jgi:hypothetical protein
MTLPRLGSSKKPGQKAALTFEASRYLYIPEADGNTAVGQIVRGSIDLVDQQTNQVMANFTM